MATPYTTAANVRSLVPPLADENTFTDVMLGNYIAEFEAVAEDYRGVAFTPRDSVERHSMMTYAPLQLFWPKVRSITSISIDGTAQTTDQYQLDQFGRVIGLLSAGPNPYGSWATVTYSHGFDAPPAGTYGPLVVRACVQYVRAVALRDLSDLNRDVISFSDGGMTYRYSTPSKEAGRPTGFIEVDRLLNSLPDYRTVGIG